MNKLIYFLCLLLGIVAITSCTKEDNDNCTTTRNIFLRVIGDTTPIVRAISDDYDPMKIAKLDLWINHDGDLKWYLIRSYSRSEIDAEGYVAISLPEGREYNFVAVSNYQTDTKLDFPGVMNINEVAIPSVLSAHNNSRFSYLPHQTIAQGYRSVDSLLMSKVVDLYLPKVSEHPGDVYTDVSLKRITAKILFIPNEDQFEGDSVRIITTNTVNGYTLASVIQAGSYPVYTSGVVNSQNYVLQQIVFPTAADMSSTIMIQIKYGNVRNGDNEFETVFRINEMEIYANDLITIYYNGDGYTSDVDLWDYPRI